MRQPSWTMPKNLGSRNPSSPRRKARTVVPPNIRFGETFNASVHFNSHAAVRAHTAVLRVQINRGSEEKSVPFIE